MAAKQTSALIPLCHPLPLSSVHVELTPTARGYDIEARVSTTAQTGVEMEALTAVAVAALTVYDMVKAVDKAMVIGDVRLVFKSGGRSGVYRGGEGGKGGKGGKRRNETFFPILPSFPVLFFSCRRLRRPSPRCRRFRRRLRERPSTPTASSTPIRTMPRRSRRDSSTSMAFSTKARASTADRRSAR